MSAKRQRQLAKRKAKLAKRGPRNVFRLRNPRPLTTGEVKESDHLMLRAAKGLLEEGNATPDTPDTSILVVADLRDEIGAVWAYSVNATEEASDDPDVNQQRVDEFRAGFLGHDGRENPTPFVAFWVDRSPEVLDLLVASGFNTPKEWYDYIRHPPQAGNVYTLLKRNQAGLLMSVDFSTIEPLRRPAILLGAP